LCERKNQEVGMRYWLAVCLMLFGGAEWVAAGEAESRAQPPEPTRVVAKVGGTEITYQDLTTRVQILESEGTRVVPERYVEVLRGLVREELLLQGATTEQLAQQPLVAARLTQIRRHVLIDELLKQKLAVLGQVTDEEVRKVYDDNKALFTREEVRVSHIMVADEVEAEAIRKDAVAGKDFAALARAKSLDAGSAEKGGDLGVLAPGLTEPEFEEAAGKLAEGEIGPVVKTQQGYHVIKAGPRQKVIEPWEAVQGRIREMLAQQKQRDVLVVYIRSLETAAKPEIFEDRLH
jgi:peptidyl-prolyl cis-trans isomerase C